MPVGVFIRKPWCCRSMPSSKALDHDPEPDKSLELDARGETRALSLALRPRRCSPGASFFMSCRGSGSTCSTWPALSQNSTFRCGRTSSSRASCSGLLQRPVAFSLSCTFRETLSAPCRASLARQPWPSIPWPRRTSGLSSPLAWRGRLWRGRRRSSGGAHLRVTELTEAKNKGSDDHQAGYGFHKSHP